MDKEDELRTKKVALWECSDGFELWDELFTPLWAKIVQSFKTHCSAYHPISDDDAEDMAAETILRLVRYFDHQVLVDLTPENRRRRLWGYIKQIQPGVTASFFKKRFAERELPPSLEAPKIDSPPEAESLHDQVVRDALLQLSQEDRDLLEMRVVHEWTFPHIHEEIQTRWEVPVSVGGLKMRYARALSQLKEILSKKRL